MKSEKFSLVKRLKSFGYAFNGLKLMFKEEHNSRIHLLAAIVAIAMGWFLEINLSEWAILLLAIGAVFSAEIFNSAIENLADHLAPDRHEKIRKVKDLAAAAVLVCAITAVAVGCLVFLPKIWCLLHNS